MEWRSKLGDALIPKRSNGTTDWWAVSRGLLPWLVATVAVLAFFQDRLQSSEDQLKVIRAEISPVVIALDRLADVQSDLVTIAKTQDRLITSHLISGHDSDAERITALSKRMDDLLIRNDAQFAEVRADIKILLREIRRERP